MKGKSYSIPYGMVFKKYYCSHCGSKLIKSKTHRVVSKDDKDYYQYHEIGHYPKHDYDVYSYEFKCINCNKKISYNEQCVIERIQKKKHKIILSRNEIKENYKEEQLKDNKRILTTNILIPTIMLVLVFALFYLLDKGRTNKKLLVYSLLCMVLIIYNSLMTIRGFNGKNKLRRNRDYSNDEKIKVKRLHAYSSNNKDLIEKSEYCYCFFCKKKIESNQIVRYLENEDTALCPYCGVDSIIPDCVDVVIDDKTIDNMYNYWF